MANPTWFDADYYLKGKLAQLKAVDPQGKLNDGKVWSTVDDVKAALEAAGYEGDEGLYQHFVDHGMDENISPNEGFDAMFYLKSKADDLNVVKYEGKEWTAASVLNAFKAAGIESAWEHYQLYGSNEGIATSIDFDSEAYFVAKVKQLNDTGYDTRTNWTVDEVKAAFAEQGLTALEHYQLYGEDEKIADYGKFGATKPVAKDGGLNILTGATVYETLEDALAAQADGTLAENYSIKNTSNAGDVTVAQQVGIADLLAGATPAITATPSYTLADTVEAISNVSTLVMQGSAGGKGTYKIVDTLDNIIAAKGGSVLQKASEITASDLGEEDGLGIKGLTWAFDSETGFVSTAKKPATPWEGNGTDDLLVATHDKAIDFDTLKGLDWTGVDSFTKAMDGAENILEGGKGNDFLVGKDGAQDIFLFNSWVDSGSLSSGRGGTQLGTDTIYNFEIGTDKLLVYDSNGGKFVDANFDEYVKISATKDGTAITIDGKFFNDGTGAVEGDLTINLVGVVATDAFAAGADLFAFVPAE